MELREELKNLGVMALVAIIMLFAFASAGGAIGYGIHNGEAFSIVAGIGTFISVIAGFFVLLNKKRNYELEIRKLNDEIEELKKLKKK
jgi:multidrug transporter EmrE-like cation transporter